MSKKISKSNTAGRPNENFDLVKFAESVKRKIPSYDELVKTKWPEYKKWLSHLRERLRKVKEENKDKQIFVVLGTGGTFQSAPGPDGYEPTGTLQESFDALQLPKDDSIHLDLCDLMNLDSSQMTVEQWRFLAEAIIELEATNSDMFDGIIITHGTDTMSKGASYLSYMLRGFPKSIVFTGSQFPAREEGSDAKDQVERAIITSKLAAKVDRRISEIMAACGEQVTRAVWAQKLGDVTTNAFGPWNQPRQNNNDSTDWETALRNGTVSRIAPSLLDFSTGKHTGGLRFASHAIEYGKRPAYDPFTKIVTPADIYPVRLTDKSPASFARHLIGERAALLSLLGAATADEVLLEIALAAANEGKIVICRAPFPDSTVQPGKYKAGANVRKNVPLIQRPVPYINGSDDALEAKINVLIHKLGIQPAMVTRGLGAIYTSEDLRKFYEHMEDTALKDLV